MKQVVIDTNIILVCISKKSSLRWIYDALLNGDYNLCVSNSIIDEYAEIIERHMGIVASSTFLDLIVDLSNVKHINTFYDFHLLKDEEDNKFVDCAIAANAHFIVSHDKDFNILKNIEFPKINVINVEEFKRELNL